MRPAIPQPQDLGRYQRISVAIPTARLRHKDTRRMGSAAMRIAEVELG